MRKQTQPNIRPTVFEPQNDMAIYRLFGYRCVWCNKRIATELNHIVPRSRDRSLINDWKNKAPMCHWCHEEYHRGGVTQEKIQSLQQKRAEVLVSMHKSQYV